MIRSKLTRFWLAALFASAAPALAAEQPVDVIAGSESIETNSAVSLAAGPRLSDGRLVLKVAAMNRTDVPVAFGPDNVSLTTADGKPIPWVPLKSLVDDVLIAAGIPVDETASSELPSSYSGPAMTTNQTGQLDVTGYTGSMGVAGDQFNARRAAERAKKIKPEKLDEIMRQVAGLEAGILRPAELAPGEIGSGQLVSEELNFHRGDDRLLTVRIEVAGEEHSFLFEAPKD